MNGKWMCHYTDHPDAVHRHVAHVFQIGKACSPRPRMVMEVKWLEALPWPIQCPNLNHSKHVWDIISRRLNEREHSILMNGTIFRWIFSGNR